ncbi:major facilitator superfamily domain-containing protein [Paraphoma chrysanthemicola]|uniref:Major facilitator superfamily domain-containing protein n=1 Tax=Paraphoma chrysanthemicola TaxID=798071 RepID=A0A8K0VRD5_9PLEO|nr:major facilitator superfamily domain-containing protein [Paraphoma chrysanthemicola]
MEEESNFWAPGTVRLAHATGSAAELILHPVPTSDPDDPLNWSTTRKTINFGLVSFFVLWTFVQLDIGFAAWGPMQEELGLTVDEMNKGVGINYGGLAIGCILFLPFVHKYGRRPLYLFSSALQLASVVWQAEVNTFGDLMGSNLISGLGGAISEAIVQITIADVFFVHQHGTMNGWFLLVTSIGTFLGPVASGYVIESQGWRWTWWWCVIFMTVNLFLVVFLFEESKYVPGSTSHNPTHGPLEQLREASMAGHFDHDTRALEKLEHNGSLGQSHLGSLRSATDSAIPRHTYRRRLRLVTPSTGSISHHFYQPIIVLFSFPAVTYAALTYGIVLASFAIITSVQAIYLIEPPYNFGADGIGLMNIAPFVGACAGFLLVSFVSDKSIFWLSKRNEGIYEPEMRLWLALMSTVLLPGAVLMFGIGLARGVQWAVLAVALGLFGFNLVIVSDVALSYVMDSYHEIIGDALVGIVFVRNVVSVLALFALTPWIDDMGVQDVHILTAAVCFAVLLLPVPLLVWGKRARIATAKRYERMLMRQPTHRTL